MGKKLFALLFFCLLAAGETHGQINYQLNTKSKKAAAYFVEADKFRVRGQYDQAIEMLEEAIRKDDEFYDAYLQLGLIQKARGHLSEARETLEHMATLPHANHAPTYFELADLYIQLAEYELAIENSEAFLALNPSNEKRSAQAQQIVDNANFALENAANAAEYNPQPLPGTVNAFPMQYFPVLTVDGNAIVFTRRNGVTMEFDEDLVISRRDVDGQWGSPESISDVINSEFNEGTCTLSADGRRLIFTSCNGRRGYGSCDLFISERTGDEWSEPENLGNQVNGAEWDSQPSLSPDGRTLYFVSTRRGGIGSRDIWMSTLNESGEWTKAVNLGASVNTPGEDISPFIHPNNKTLYFATNGRTGFGGFDIFYTERAPSGWSDPVNFGAPVNTGEDQVSLFITADGKKGYYSLEDQSDPDVKSKIYEINVPEALQVSSRASYVFGQVTDETTGEPLAALIELYDLSTEERIGLVNSDSVTGSYLIVLAEGAEYALYVNRKGYLFSSLSFEYTSSETLEPVQQNIALTPIKKGSVTVLNNIFFATDEYVLEDRSKTELMKVVRFLAENQDVRIEISGHTDNIGAPGYNLSLSNKRAKSVYDFITQNGGNVSQMTYAGYGQTRPAYPNDNDANRAKNRRIEFRITD